MNARWSGHQEDPTTSNVHSLASALTNMSPVSFSSVARHGLKRQKGPTVFLLPPDRSNCIRGDDAIQD
eukprot:scaffold15449_cov14-Tisochrysis_lutea.AAC.3